MWHPQGAPRRLIRWTRRLLLALLLPALLLAGYVQWWLLPRLDGYRADLAASLSEYLHLPVTIEGMTAVRDGWRLGLRLRGIRLHEPSRDAALAHFAQAAITFDLWRSLREWRPVLGRIRFEGVNLTLEQGPDGLPRLSGGGESAATPTVPEVGRWLFSLPRLEIVGERLALRRPDGGSLQLLHPYFQLQQVADGQRLTFAAELPAGFGDRLQLEIERRLDPAAAKDGQGTFRLRADRLDLAGWPLPLAFESGQAALEVSGEWQDWRPLRGEGQLRLHRAALKAEPRSALLKPWLARQPDGELRVAWRNRDSGWRLEGGVRFSDGKGQITVQPSFIVDRSAEGWRGQGRDWRAQDLMAWLTPWLDDAARRWLVPLEVRGELPQIDFRSAPDGADYLATLQLRDLSCQSVRKLPCFDNLTGLLELGPQSGRLKLDSRRVRVDTAGLMRAPFTLDTLAGAVIWRRSEAGIRLESDGLTAVNPDLNGRFWGSMTVPDAGEPVLDIRGDYRDVRADQAKRYLPVAVIPPEAVAWLDRALVGGRVVSGDLVFRGPPARFPFDGGEGLFETRFRVENAIVDYMPGWPRLERGRTTVTFRNRGLWVEADSGRLRDGEVEKLGVVIEDLDQVVVQVKGRAKGSGASMWRVLEDSPAGRALGEDLPALAIEGPATLDLELVLPLDARPSQIRGRVGLLDNGVTLNNSSLDLRRLRGEVRFSEKDIGARDVQARLWGQPVQIDLDLAGREGSRELRARARGRLALAELLEGPAGPLKAHVGGKSDWEAVLTVPTHRRERPNAVPAFNLNLGSNLRGTRISLPAPFAKTAAEAKPLRLSVQPAADGAKLKLGLDYGPQVRAAVELSGFPRQPRFERGELRVNAGAAKVPEEPGLAVVANLARWSPEFPVAQTGGEATRRRAAAANEANADPATGAMRVLRAVDARIEDLVIGGRSLGRVEARARRRPDGMAIECAGEALSGDITLPEQPTPQRPVTFALKRLRVGRAVEPPPDRGTGLSEVDPRALPPLALTVADLRWEDSALGRLRLNILPRPDGIRLNEVLLESDRQRIEASGEWLAGEAGHSSALKASLRGRSLGETLASFGYSGSGVERGETEAELALEWKAALPDIALERLTGTLKLRVGPGQLRDIKPGLGRLIGMLNVQNLTRRLSFDFSDLFRPGMGFDRIAGEFVFRHGNAFNDDLLIEAPAARIDIRGRTGLQARDYDQIITVVPNVGGALPVAGALAGGPAVGAAVFVAERLLQKDIEQATRYRYALKGSWDDPVIEALQRPPEQNPAKGFASDN
ncbi:MAG: TIGR02099 family protein [Candidatus Competibacteraceae bacterium]|nr:TIGR02099 family protein [Candidatus Competibacteraceae bacterium]